MSELKFRRPLLQGLCSLLCMAWPPRPLLWGWADKFLDGLDFQQLCCFWHMICKKCLDMSIAYKSEHSNWLSTSSFYFYVSTRNVNTSSHLLKAGTTDWFSQTIPSKKKMSHWNENNYSIEMSSLFWLRIWLCTLVMKISLAIRFPGSNCSISTRSSSDSSLTLLVHCLFTVLAHYSQTHGRWGPRGFL